MEQSLSALLIDHLLWMEKQIDEGREEALSCLPGLHVQVPASYLPESERVVVEPNFQMLKKNLRHLSAQKEVICSDIAIATGIKQSILEAAFKTGRMQAILLPQLCFYFNVAPMELLAVDLAEPAPGLTPTTNKAEVLSPSGSNPGAAAPTEQPVPAVSDPPNEKSVDDWVIEQDPVCLARTSSQNLQSLLFERDVTPPALSRKSGLSYSIVLQYLQGAAIPTDYSLPKLARALEVKEADIFDPKRVGIRLDRNKIKANLEAIVEYSRWSIHTYAAKLNIGAPALKHIIRTGEISPSQASKIAEREKISVEELLTQDLTARFPRLPVIDPLVVARNLNSIMFEKGLLRKQFAKQNDLDQATLGRYLAGTAGRLATGTLRKISEAFQISLEDLIDSKRHEIKPSAFFAPNLRHLCAQTGAKPSTICRGFAVSITVIEKLSDGSVAPKPGQVAGLCRLFGLSPAELLMQDMTSKRIVRRVDDEGGACWRLDVQAN